MRQDKATWDSLRFQTICEPMLPWWLFLVRTVGYTQRLVSEKGRKWRANCSGWRSLAGFAHLFYKSHAHALCAERHLMHSWTTVWCVSAEGRELYDITQYGTSNTTLPVKQV